MIAFLGDNDCDFLGELVGDSLGDNKGDSLGDNKGDSLGDNKCDSLGDGDGLCDDLLLRDPFLSSCGLIDNTGIYLENLVLCDDFR